MRKFRYILLLAAIFGAVSCVVDNVEYQGGGVNTTDAVTVIGRMTRFDDHDVTSRGVKNEDEAKLTSMAMALFPVNDDGTALAGNCVYYQYSDNQAELLFTIERGSNYTYDARYAMYVFCNMPGLGAFGVGSTLEEMMAAFYEVENIDIPTNGFPMMGSLGDTFSTTFDKDGKVFILSPLKDGELTTPKVDGVTQTLLTIPMKAMYAKVNFTIEVRPDQTIEGNYSPQFTLEGYTVNNVPSKVDFSNDSNSENEVLADSFTRPVEGYTVASGANKINFTFYLPERLMEPTTKPADYPYPFKTDGKIRGEDSLYMQRYKPKLVGDKKATNVKISGRYRDHQNHHWDVDYKIYLGEDNYGDFNIRRNCEYNNFVTIRGIQTSSDMSDKQDAISIDHRVTIERTQPAIISLRREVLLDSHFEVRPLRVRKSEIDESSINAVKVEVVNPTTTTWMRLERSFGDGTPEGSPQTTVNGTSTSIYIDSDANSASYGKRKFFTYNLIDGVNANATDASLVNSTEVILPLTAATECCWIYIDECTETGDAVRSGIVKVSYGSYDGTTFTPANNANYPDVQYVINQRKLFQVTYDDPETTDKVENYTYNIEYEEEYLHNFDADDDFGQTEYEGMPWGLDGIQLSYADNSDGDGHFSVIAKSGDSWINDIIDGFMNYFISSLNSFYDFYVKKHDSGVMSIESNLHDRKGWDFCNEIIQVVNGYGYNVPTAKPENSIDELSLDEKPKSAVEYCYNKNKRNNKGEVVWQNTDGTYDQTQLNWYLPAIDEIEDIVMSNYGSGLKTYARFLDFQNKFYWSSQPAFNKNLLHYNAAVGWRISANYDFYTDDVLRARATRVGYNTAFYEESSSVEGYREVIHLRGTGTNDKTTYNLETLLQSQDLVSYSYSYNTGIFSSTTGTMTFDKSDLITRKAGNKPRTSYARVRCVRKQ